VISLAAFPCSGLRPAPRGGFAPATLPRTKTKTFLRRKNKKHPAPSRWSGRGLMRHKEMEKNLPELVPTR
jgi:hypothetical protein